MADLEKQLEDVFALQREYFHSHLKSAPVSVRKLKLKKLKKWILENQDRICAAIFSDFRKPELEVKSTEIYPLISAIKHTMNHIDSWTKPKKVDAGLSYMFTKSSIKPEPKGQALVISPWNYPFMLALEPVVSAIAAGCTVILKPSEHTPHTAELISEMAKDVFDEKELAVFKGDYLVSQALLKIPFNHVFFTGGTEVGKIVMKAAAENLASVTLELGGMNPCIIDETADLKDAAEKILWAKCMNSAQSCVSVNEIFIHKSVENKFISELSSASKRLYPNGFKDDNTMSSIVNKNHYNRLKTLIRSAEDDGGKVAFGGEYSEELNWIGPTILIQVPEKSEIRNQEIFGPLAALNTFENRKDVYDYLNKRPIPLAAYIFSTSRKNQNEFISKTQSGSTAINDTTLQFAHNELPFGGQNSSGIGKAHGYCGFMEFTNLRSQLKQRRGFTTAKLIYPPYNKSWKNTVMKFLTKWF